MPCSKKGGDHLLKVKANQRDLKVSITAFFTRAPPAGSVVTEATQISSHADRVETRKLRASTGLNA